MSLKYYHHKSTLRILSSKNVSWLSSSQYYTTRTKCSLYTKIKTNVKIETKIFNV